MGPDSKARSARLDRKYLGFAEHGSVGSSTTFAFAVRRSGAPFELADMAGTPDTRKGVDAVALVPDRSNALIGIPRDQGITLSVEG